MVPTVEAFSLTEGEVPVTVEHLAATVRTSDTWKKYSVEEGGVCESEGRGRMMKKLQAEKQNLRYLKRWKCVVRRTGADRRKLPGEPISSAKGGGVMMPESLEEEKDWI